MVSSGYSHCAADTYSSPKTSGNLTEPALVERFLLASLSPTTEFTAAVICSFLTESNGLLGDSKTFDFCFPTAELCPSVCI